MTGYRRDAFVLALAVGVVGMTFGVLAESSGIPLVKSTAMSLFVLTGASQFAAVSVVRDGGSGYAAVASALILAARNALYGSILGRYFNRGPAYRAFAALFVIDETTGMATAQADEDDALSAFWWTAALLTAFWVGGTAVGALIGERIGDPNRWGLDAAFPASFVALLAPHVRTRPAQVAALGGGLIALAALPWTKPGIPLLLAALAVVPALVRQRKQSS